MADIKDKTSMSSIGRDILRSRESKLSRKSVDEVRSEQEIVNMQREMKLLEQELISLRDPKSSSRDLQEFNRKLSEFTAGYRRIEEIKKEIDKLKNARFHVAEKQFQSGMQTAMSSRSTHEDINRVARSLEMIGPASDLANQQTSLELERHFANRRRKIELQSQRVLESAKNIENDPSTFYRRFNIRERLLHEQGVSAAAMTLQRQQGLDTRTTYLESNRLAQQIEKDFGLDKVRSDTVTGKISPASAKADLDITKREFVSAVRDFNDALRKGASNIGDFERRVVDLQNKYSQQTAVLDEVNRQGKNFKGFLGTVAQGVGVAGQAIITGAQVARYGFITSEMQQTEQRGRYANIAVDQYKDIFGMAQGDAGSRRRILSRIREVAASEAQRMKGLETGVAIGEAGGVGLQGAGGAAAGILSGDILGGISGGVQSFGQAAQQAIGVAKGISPNEVYLQRFQQIVNLSDKMNQINDRFMNRFTTLQLGLTEATRGLGIGAGGLGADRRPIIGREEIIKAGLPNATDVGEAAKLLDRQEKKEHQALDTFPRQGMPGEQAAIFGQMLSKALIRRSDPRQMLSPLHGPGSVTSGYGMRNHPITGSYSQHQGIDAIPTSGDWRLQAMGSGQVYSSGYGENAGNYLGIQYGDDLRVKYMHMAQMSRLRAGQRVAGGDIVGQVGSSGRSTGAHAHIQADRLDPKTGKWIPFDPMSIIGNQLTYGGGALPSGLRTSPSVDIPVRAGVGDRETAFQSIMDNLSAIGAAGISDTDLPRVVGAGRSMLGKPFTRGAGGQIVEAGRMAQAGYFESPEQYFQARGALSNMGGTQQNLADLLKNAVASGLDSSKNIMEMVQGISNFGDELAASGVEAAGGAIQALNSMVGGARAEGLSENVAVRAGMSGMQQLISAQESGRFDLGGVAQVENQRRFMEKNNINLPLNVRMSLRKANPLMLEELLRAYDSNDTQKQRMLENQIGLEPGQGNAALIRNELVGQRQKFMINQGAGFTMGNTESAREAAKYMESLQTWSSAGIPGQPMPAMSDKLARYISATAGAQGVKGLPFSSIKYGLFGREQNAGDLPMGGGGLVGAGETQRQLPGEMGMKEVDSALKGITETFGDVRAMVQATSEIIKGTDPKAWSDAAKDAAKDMAAFSTKGLDDVLSRFVGAFGPLVTRVEGVLQQKNTRGNIDQNTNNVVPAVIKGLK